MAKRKKSRKQMDEEVGNVSLKFNDDAKKESYDRYKYRCIRDLVLKSLLFFILGIAAAFFFRLLIGL